MKKKPDEFQRRLRTTETEEIHQCARRRRGIGGPTLRDGLNASPSSQKVRTDDTSEDGQRDYASPPADNVADHINLTLRVILCPEGDARKKEGPVYRVCRIGMGGG